MSTYLLHTSPEGKKTLYSFISHVPKEIPKSELSEIDIPTDKAGLIAAAPELLEALEKLVGECPQEYDFHGNPTDKDLEAALVQARAAIAKAKGGDA